MQKIASLLNPEVYSEPCEISKTKRFAKTVNGSKSFRVIKTAFMRISLTQIL